MAVNYKAQLDQLDEQEKAALAENEQYFKDHAAASDAAYDSEIAGVADWKTQQEGIQNERNSFELQKIEQQQEQAKQDYEKEQRAAYTDWQKQSATHGVAAEQMAAAGMTGSGYAESSKVQMYTAYQRRLVAAKESMDKLTISFNNAMTEARLQNSSALAQIAYEAYEKESKLIMAKLGARDDIFAAQQESAEKIADAFGDKREEITNSPGYQLWLEGQQPENPPEQSPQFNNYFSQFQTADPTKSINMDSVFDLGFGRITGDELNRLVKDGAVEAYEDGGEIYFRKADPKTAGLPGGQQPGQQQYAPPPATAPNSVDGHGALTAATDKDGKATNLKKAADGTLWYWDGTKNSYSQYQPNIDNMTLDMKSVNALGYNNLNPADLEDLVANGFVEEIYDGFTIKVRLTEKGRKNKRAMDRMMNA